MRKKTFQFGSASTDYYFSGKFAELKKLVDPKKAVIITDDNLSRLHGKKFKGWNVIRIRAGEEYKVQATVDSIIDQLIALRAERSWTLVGVGGGVVTDITGFAASIFLRGVNFGFVPTTVLAMVDASIGGKNGIDAGVYKNMIGTIRQPSFLLYDVSFLKTLPEGEWRNGFAEIIKHAAVMDARMFASLEKHNLSYFKKDQKALADLVRRNAVLKTTIVQDDEFEKNIRRILNFGHTLGHAVENTYKLSHGEAVAIGMCFAAKLSEKFTAFRQEKRFISLVDRYKLPVTAGYNKKKIFEVLLSDKKREGDTMNFILLNKVGKAVIRKIPLEQLYKLL